MFLGNELKWFESHKHGKVREGIESEKRAPRGLENTKDFKRQNNFIKSTKKQKERRIPS